MYEEIIRGWKTEIYHGISPLSHAPFLVVETVVLLWEVTANCESVKGGAHHLIPCLFDLMSDLMFDLIFIFILIIIMHDLLNKEQIYILCVYYKFGLVIFSQTMVRLETPVLSA